jgi:hypothetical protein
MVGWSMSAAMTAGFLTDDLVIAIWRRGKPNRLADVFHNQAFRAGVPVGRFSDLNDNNAAQNNCERCFGTL